MASRRIGSASASGPCRPKRRGATVLPARPTRMAPPGTGAPGPVAHFSMRSYATCRRLGSMRSSSGLTWGRPGAPAGACAAAAGPYVSAAPPAATAARMRSRRLSSVCWRMARILSLSAADFAARANSLRTGLPRSGLCHGRFGGPAHDLDEVGIPRHDDVMVAQRDVRLRLQPLQLRPEPLPERGEPVGVTPSRRGIARAGRGRGGQQGKAFVVHEDLDALVGERRVPDEVPLVVATLRDRQGLLQRRTHRHLAPGRPAPGKLFLPQPQRPAVATADAEAQAAMVA